MTETRNQYAPVPLRILLVEDDPLIGYAAMSDLADAGFEVELCVDGVDGLRAASSRSFDLVVTDHLMPRLTGVEMVAALRRAGIATPVLLTTSVPVDQLPASASVDCDAYLSKPYLPSEICRLALALIDNDHQRRHNGHHPRRVRLSVDA